MMAAIGVIWSVLKMKYLKVVERKPLLPPEAILSRYFSKRRGREVV
jgi:hypothetical protein